MKTEDNIIKSLNSILSNTQQYDNSINEGTIYIAVTDLQHDIMDALQDGYDSEKNLFDDEIDFDKYADLNYETVADSILDEYFKNKTDSYCWNTVYYCQFSNKDNLREAMSKLELDTVEFTFGSVHGVNSLNEFMRKVAKSILYTLILDEA